MSENPPGQDLPAPYSHVACCVDGSDASGRAVAEVRRLREHARRVSVVHVIAPPALPVALAASLGGAAPIDMSTETAAAKAWLDQVAGQIRGAEAVLLDGHPAHTVCGWAEAVHCDLLVAASHSGLVERALLGSFSGYLAHHAPCPVLLVRPLDEANAGA